MWTACGPPTPNGAAASGRPSGQAGPSGHHARRTAVPCPALASAGVATGRPCAATDWPTTSRSLPRRLHRGGRSPGRPGTPRPAIELPTAVVAGNNRSAHGVLATFARAGVRSTRRRIHRRLRRQPGGPVVVHRPHLGAPGRRRVAELAIQAASERLDDGRTTERDIVLQPTLVVRGSTGPAPALS